VDSGFRFASAGGERSGKVFHPNGLSPDVSAAGANPEFPLNSV
jgi:hypothetical protein